MLRPTLPNYDYSLVIRTDFSNESAWEQICKAIQQPQTEHGFLASVEYLSEVECAGLDPEAIRSRLPEQWQRSVVFLVDATALASSDPTLLVADFSTTPAQTFRVIPSELWSVENNLRIANMDFEEFASACGEDGVFRGFPV
jgi:hypothetical protein